MAKLTRNNFTAGEVSPSLRLRQDLAMFESGLKTCKNVIVTPEGGVRSRHGSQTLNTLGTATGFADARIIPFIFNRDQTYQVLFTPTSISILYMGNLITDSNSNPQVFTPSSPSWPGYTADDIQRIQYTQILDVLLLTVEGKKPLALKRGYNEVWSLSSGLWGDKKLPPVSLVATTSALLSNMSYDAGTRTLSAKTVTGGPSDYTGRRIGIYDANPSSIFNKYDWDLIVTDAVLSGSDVMLTMRLVSIPGPTADEQGAIPGTALGEITNAVKVGDPSAAGTYKKDYYYRVTAVTKDGRETPPSAVVTGHQINTLTAVNGLKFSWNDWLHEEILYYRVYKETSTGSGIFGWIGDANSTSFEDYNVAPLTSDNITSSEGIEVSNAAAVALYQQRLFLGGGGALPAQILSSRTGDYFSLKTSSPIKDIDAFVFNLSTPSYERVVSMVSLDRLYVFTSEGIWGIGEGVNEVMTPTTFSAKKLSYVGASTIPPIVQGSRVMFVPPKRDRIFIATFGGQEGSSALEDVTLTARHLFDGHKIKEVIRRSEGGDSFWVLRTDGTVLCLTYLPDHKIAAWSVFEYGGEARVISLTCVPEAGSETVYAIVTRGSQAVLERLTPPPFEDVTPSMDGWVVYHQQGQLFSTLMGLDHLEGREVMVMADGHPEGPLAVTGGQVQLEVPVRVAYAGMAFNAEVETFPVYPATNEIGQRGQLVKARAHLFDDSPVRLYTGHGVSTALPRDVGDGYGTPTPGDYLDFHVPPEWQDGMTIRAVADYGVPLRLLALELQIEY